MNGETTRRAFLQGGTLAAATAAAQSHAQAQETHSQHEHQHAHEGPGAIADFPRDRPSGGQPVGSPADRGMLVPGLRPAGEPPPRVIAPDLPEKLAWTLVDGVKEFHLYCRNTRRE